MEVVDNELADSQGKKKKRGERKTGKAVEKKKKKSEEAQSEAKDQIRVTTGTSHSNVGSGIRISEFDYSADNHFRVMDTIYELYAEAYNGGFDDYEIERLASTITFLSEWRYFNYRPRVIRFAPETGPSNGEEARKEIILSQFSAATVPKCDIEAQVSDAIMPTELRKDFVLYVGGLVWAVDWCPRQDQGTNSDTKCEFIAVAAHPPDSTYHKLGEPLSGRGMIQIWCLLNNASTKEDAQAPTKKEKWKLQKKTIVKDEQDKAKRPRGRPRKKVVDENPAVTDPEAQFTRAVVLVPENASDVPPVDINMMSDPAPLNMEAALGNTKQKFQKKSESGGRQPGKKAMDKTFPVVDPKGQFIEALAVQLLEDTSNMLPSDENILTTSAPLKLKGRKRKAVANWKNAVDKAADTPDSDGPIYQALAIEYPENMQNITSKEENSLNAPGSQEETGKKKKVPTKRVHVSDLGCTIAALRKKLRKKSKGQNDPGPSDNVLSTQNQVQGPSLASQNQNCSGKDDMLLERNIPGDNILDLGSRDCHVPEDAVLPRVVLCLGHDGKVAWDVKWRPCNACEPVNKHRMGYLAVVLGDGSIEVWEIPSPQIVKCIYASRRGEGTDPRFAKLKPVFRCSLLKYGDRKSMPLTVEWSASPPHNLILAGCHDGVVALWKFSADGSSEDTRPLLCFSAETVPIRALAWAPFEGDTESSNVIVTAGHGGLKFWDLRDPFRPLWDANPSQRFIYGLDWLPDPRCVIVSYDDGTLRILSLSRAAYDVPVTGEPFTGTQHQGLQSYYCSSFAIWSIHVSRLTGMVAYCSADGTVLYFQLTHKAVDKDPLRNRAPHFLCGSVSNDESAVTMNTQLPSSPHRMKKSATEWANTPRSSRSVVSGLNQSKRARNTVEKTQKSDDQVLALCYGDDPRNEDPNEAQRSSKSRKGKTSKSKKASNDKALVCFEGDAGNTDGRSNMKEEASCATEVPPPKIVSMYRVRWNMNKGSERWLCYGGAAGIVRCQEIVAPVIDKKLLRR